MQLQKTNLQNVLSWRKDGYSTNLYKKMPSFWAHRVLIQYLLREVCDMLKINSSRFSFCTVSASTHLKFLNGPIKIY